MLQLVKKGLIGLLIGLVIYGLFSVNTFYLIENNFTDRLTSLLGDQDVDLRIKILAIDDASLEEVGKWPWPRNKIAEVTEELAENGAKAVWTDVLYTEKSSNPEEDQHWNNISSQYTNIYHSSNFVFTARQQKNHYLSYEKFNLPIYEVPMNQIGHINVMEDRDKLVRQVILGVPTNEGDMIPAISVRLANLLLSKDQQITWNRDQWFLGEMPLKTGNRNEIFFQYTSSPQRIAKSDVKSFAIFSIKDVMNGSIPSNYFKDSVVLIGPYSVGLGDQYHTPQSKTLKMFGVEIHANLIQSFLNQSLYSPVSKHIGGVIIILLSIITVFLVDLVKARWAVFVAIGVFLLYTTILLSIFQAQQLLLPYFYPILAIVLAYVTSIVWQYLLEQKEKKRVTGIFGRYVSKSVVNEILASKEEIRVGGVRKDVTLMFVDIRGFTPLSEKMEPEEVVNVLNEYLDLGARAVFSNEGTIDKFIGDGIMALFGAPIEQPDHAIRAAKSALIMKEEADMLAKRLLERYGKSVSFGIGLNSGPAVIGNIGSFERLDYTAIGDTVNLAARLESNAKPGQILISEDTYERIKDHFVCTPLEPIKVKGKENLVNIYQLERAKNEKN